MSCQLSLLACLVWQLRNEALVLQQLKDDAVPEAKSCTGLRLAPERGQQPVVAPAPEYRPQLTSPVPALKDHPCDMTQATSLRCNAQ